MKEEKPEPWPGTWEIQRRARRREAIAWACIIVPLFLAQLVALFMAVPSACR